MEGDNLIVGQSLAGLWCRPLNEKPPPTQFMGTDTTDKA
jgi:hypothetical protein